MKSRIIVFLGPSAAGKTRIQKELNLPKIVTTTTRGIRKGEKNGRDYFFQTESVFKDYIQNGKLIEWTQYSGSYYGLEKTVIEEALKRDTNQSIILDKNGAAAIKALWPQRVIIIGVYAGKEAIYQRLVARNETQLESRLAQYEAEISDMLRLSDLIYHSNSDREPDIQALLERHLKCLANDRGI